MTIYIVRIGKHDIETDRKPVITKTVNRLKRKGLEEGKDFYIKGMNDVESVPKA